jgi:hypothetical protein
MEKSNYDQYSFTLSKKEIEERNRIIDWLPDEIIDAHAHLNHQGLVSGHEFFSKHPISTFLNFTTKKSAQLKKVLFPGKQVSSLWFPYPFVGIDWKLANLYLLKNVSRPNRIALLGIPEDNDYTNAILEKDKPAALKMYPWMVIPPYERIYDFFKPEILEVCQAQRVPIILHLPSGVEANLGQVQQLMTDFPSLWVVLAHLGVPSSQHGEIHDVYRALKKYSHLMLDTTLVLSSSVIEAALKVFGHERLMYGTDEPISMIRGTLYQHPVLGERVASAFPYHWVDQEEYQQFGYLAKDAIHFHWQALIALQKAIATIYGLKGNSVIEAIFFMNAKDLYFS